MRLNLPVIRPYNFMANDTKFAWVWLIIRVYIGWLWLEAGWEKFGNPAWAGDQAGAAIKGFVAHAVTLTTGEHPQVFEWYANFLQNTITPNAAFFSYLITYGELAVGIALILGIMTGKAAFWGGFMNLNYLLAGTAGLNPLMLVFQILLVLAWRTSGWIGLDRYIVPKIMAWKSIDWLVDRNNPA